MQAYSNPERETDPHALPDVEVFYVYEKDDSFMNDGGETIEPGWYWWSCFPGCLPDGDPIGPFDTEEDALANAQENGE